MYFVVLVLEWTWEVVEVMEMAEELVEKIHLVVDLS